MNKEIIYNDQNKGLIFSLMKEEDLESISSYLIKEKVAYYLCFGLLPKEDIKSYLLPIIMMMQESENSPRFAFTIKKEEKIIGHCGLEAIESSKDNYLLGYFLDEEYWGQGFGLIIGRFLLDFAFNKLGAIKVTGDCFEDNQASQKIMRKLEMKEEACLRNQFFRHGMYHHQLYFGILKEEYSN